MEGFLTLKGYSDLHIDLGSLIDLYLHAEFYWNGINVLWRTYVYVVTYGRTYVPYETHFILPVSRPTRKSRLNRPKYEHDYK